MGAHPPCRKAYEKALDIRRLFVCFSTKLYISADQLIGKTPLLELTHIEKENDLKATVLAKLEYLNPAGSVKDRVARAIVSSSPWSLTC